MVDSPVIPSCRQAKIVKDRLEKHIPGMKLKVANFRDSYRFERMGSVVSWLENKDISPVGEITDWLVCQIKYSLKTKNSAIL